MAELDKAFDFKAHEQAAVTEYLKRHEFYADLASAMKRILEGETVRHRRRPTFDGCRSEKSASRRLQKDHAEKARRSRQSGPRRGRRNSR